MLKSFKLSGLQCLGGFRLKGSDRSPPGSIVILRLTESRPPPVSVVIILLCSVPACRINDAGEEEPLLVPSARVGRLSCRR